MQLKKMNRLPPAEVDKWLRRLDTIDQNLLNFDEQSLLTNLLLEAGVRWQDVYVLLTPISETYTEKPSTSSTAFASTKTTLTVTAENEYVTETNAGAPDTAIPGSNNAYDVDMKSSLSPKPGAATTNTGATEAAVTNELPAEASGMNGAASIIGTIPTVGSEDIGSVAAAPDSRLTAPASDLSATDADQSPTRAAVSDSSSTKAFMFRPSAAGVVATDSSANSDGASSSTGATATGSASSADSSADAADSANGLTLTQAIASDSSLSQAAAADSSLTQAAASDLSLTQATASDSSTQAAA